MKFPTLLALCAAALAGCDQPKPAASTPVAGTPQLGIQAWTLRGGTLADALTKTQKLGIRYMEIFGGQEIGGGIAGKVSHAMDATTCDAVKKLAADHDVTIVSYGVVNGANEAEWRQIFEFGKAMGLRWINSEPNAEALPLVAKLAKETGLKVAVHNHPTPSIYWNPRTALAAIAPYAPEIGLCADTGHWARSGLDPVKVLKDCPGKIVTLHFKDLNERTLDAHDVPWGTGTSDAAGQIVALREMNFDGIVLMEYEHDTPQLESDLQRCAEYFRASIAAPLADLVAGKVAPPRFTTDVTREWADGRGDKSKRWPGPEPLLKSDLSNAEFPAGAWAFQDGVLSAKGGAGNLWTKDSYGDFVLSLEFRTGEKTNSGVFLRGSDTVNWLHNAIEVQILQGDEPDQKHVVGAIFDCLAPTRQLPVTPGEWNQMIISAIDNRIKVRLNGEEVIDMNLDKWTEAHKNPDGSPNKFERAYKDMARTGRIGLQDHGDPIEFRNLLIEKL